MFQKINFVFQTIFIMFDVYKVVFDVLILCCLIPVKGTHQPKILIFIDFLFSMELKLTFIIDFKSAFSF